jgi:putative selenate reductase molybdopterin-binding subunit
MIGELTNVAVGPAIANAVANATGARLQQLPITAERLYEALAARAKASTSTPGR